MHHVLRMTVALAIGWIALTTVSHAQTLGDSYLTYQGDLARIGWNAGETTLTHANIDNRAGGAGRFGKLWEYEFIHGTPGIREQVYAAPLYYNGVLYAATQRNWVYALNTETDAKERVIWERPLDLPLTQASFEAKLGGGCGDINPWHGITSTPVLDPESETLYVVNLTKDSDDNQMYKMYALDINTGATRPGWPVVLSGTYRGQTFEPYRLTQRGALTLLPDASGAKWVYVVFSSRCDTFAWNGWVIGVNTANPSSAPMRVFCTAPDGNGAGIWGGAGISVDDDGYMYVATGNGTFNANTGGNSFSQSVMRLNPEDPMFFERSTQNYYTIPNFVPTNNRDEDMGGCSVLIIPDQSDTETDTPHMALTCAKDGVIYLVNRDNLGGYSPPNGAQIQRLKIYLGDGSGGAKVSPAYFDAGEQGRFIYMAAGRNSAFISNYAHWGDGNMSMGSAGSVRAALGTAPALTVFNNRVVAAWVANSSARPLMIKSSPDGRNWSEAPAPINAATSVRSSPALAALGNRLAVAWIDNQTREVMVKFSVDGRQWPGTGTAVGARAAADSSPSLAVFKNELYVSWIADTDTRDIMLKSSSNGTDWPAAAVAINEDSDQRGAGAALAVFNDSLYVWWITTDLGVVAGRIFYKSSPDGIDWTADRVRTLDTANIDSQIGLAVFNDLFGQPRLHYFWLRPRAQGSAIQNRSLGRDFFSGNMALEPVATDCRESAFGSSGFGAVAFGGNLQLAFASNNPNRDLLTKIAQPAFPGRGLVALKLVVEGGKSKLVPVWATPYTFTYQPGSPYVTSNGQNDPVVWVSDSTAASSRPRIIGFNALTGAELYSSERRPGQMDRPGGTATQGWGGRKFATTVVVDGKLFIGTEGITAYGILPE